jgi:glycosyltransferase involved in cell wall biosynthesis
MGCARPYPRKQAEFAARTGIKGARAEIARAWEGLAQRSRRPAFLMHRSRLDRDLVIGYVGRLSPEKHVRLLAEIEQSLIQAGMSNYQFLIVGQGSEHAWLSGVMQRASLPGILREALYFPPPPTRLET